MSKASAKYQTPDPEDKLKLNKLCCLEDWNNSELSEIMSNIRRTTSPHHFHRKDWEWAIGILAMRRFSKINRSSVALGVGSGRELILFYLANHIKQVVATDMYEGPEWQEAAPVDFPERPEKYAPFDYKREALTVMRMSGTKLDFPADKFDLVFSFSSVEHFGGKNHAGALNSLREIERVLKSGGLAVITTEFIVNGKEHTEFFNSRTIYSDLIDRLDNLKLVEPVDLTLSPLTLDGVLDYFPEGLNWDKRSDEFKRLHPHVLLRKKDILFTSIMLVFAKS
jgi:SAM-dependent methyltransferase